MSHQDYANTKERGSSPHRRKRQRRRPPAPLSDDFPPQEEHKDIVITPLTLVRSDLRVIKPYPYTFTSFCKARWIGRTVLDVYGTEFGSYPPGYYETAIQQGRIRVATNQRESVVPLDYRLQGKDVLHHTVHRHEPAVLVSSDTPPYIAVVEETADLLAIDKPSTIPIHPCGGYQRNSLMNLLQEGGGGKGKLYTIHRLDRLTSGLVVLAKTSAAAQEWGQAIQRRDCQKFYLARVKGRFGCHIPTTTTNHHHPIPRFGDSQQTAIPQYGEYTTEVPPWDSEETISVQRSNRHSKYSHGYWMTDAVTGNLYAEDQMSLQTYSRIEHTVEGWMHVLNGDDTDTPSSMSTPSTDDSPPFVWFHIACPVRIEQPKIGVCAAGTFPDLEDALYVQTVKPAHTAIGIVRYCPVTDSTVLIIQPFTGRTHQIRVHLQYLGHSIANDPNYGGHLWFGNPEGQRACRSAQDILDQLNFRTLDGNATDQGPLEHSRTDGLVTADTPATEEEVLHAIQSDDARRGEAEPLADWIQRTCVWCTRLYGSNKTLVPISGDLSTCPIVRRAMLEFLVRSPGLWLHAFYYKVKDQSFRTVIPQWCQLKST
jgi:23S rRNA-/tRNA-specific pseudouridylate synthase